MVQYDVNDKLTIEFGRKAKITLRKEREDGSVRFINTWLSLIVAAISSKDLIKSDEKIVPEEGWEIEQTTFNDKEYVSFAHLDGYNDRIG